MNAGVQAASTRDVDSGIASRFGSNLVHFATTDWIGRQETVLGQTRIEYIYFMDARRVGVSDGEVVLAEWLNAHRDLVSRWPERALPHPQLAPDGRRYLPPLTPRSPPNVL